MTEQSRATKMVCRQCDYCDMTALTVDNATAARAWYDHMESHADLPAYKVSGYSAHTWEVLTLFSIEDYGVTGDREESEQLSRRRHPSSTPLRVGLVIDPPADHLGTGSEYP